MSTTPIPTEIWCMTWQQAGSPELKSLASSCCLVHDICPPLLFQNLTFSRFLVPMWGDKAVQQMEGAWDRMLPIVSNPHIPAMVHNWGFVAFPESFPDFKSLFDDPMNHFPQPDTLKQTGEIVLTINAHFWSTIGLYTNLRRLEILGLEFTPKFCQALACLPKLSVMYLIECDITCPASAGGVALEKFTCAHPELEWEDDMAEKCHLVSTSKLTTLTLEDPIPARVFLSVFVASGPLPHLITLTVCLDDESDTKAPFYTFLDYCPALRDLDMDIPATYAGIPLPETTIPMLCAFRGRIEIAGAFAAGRPMPRMKIDHIQDTLNDDGPMDRSIIEETLLQILASSTTMEDLALPFIPMHSSVLRLTSELFPKLKRLVFFLQNTGALQTDDGRSHLESDKEDQETADGSANGVDEVIDVEPDNTHGGPILMGEDGIMHNMFQNMLAMSSHDMDHIHEVISEKPCLGCNGLSRITGLEEIVMCYKLLAGWLILAYKPSQTVIGLVLACEELPRVEIHDRINNSTNSFPTIFWIF
ncbi:hypothetical protein DFH07DRAFT_780423 [Mycena maculata]|uniref:Uncharacterized protein n=1 Tax=Mycena maculata TaxID=230809 RepID=A0AAD7I4H2_9AGAR|nr:hypothetical protein DFH07DRAFT_780423 [Mycena maculata]